MRRQVILSTGDPERGVDMLVDLLFARIVARALAETATLEPAPDRPHNVTHDDITPHPAARRVLQSVQL